MTNPIKRCLFSLKFMKKFNNTGKGTNKIRFLRLFFLDPSVYINLNIIIGFKNKIDVKINCYN